MQLRTIGFLLSLSASLLTADYAAAAPACGGDFATWLSDFKREAAANKISPAAIAALDGITPDQSVIARDRGQKVFQQSFEEFSGRMIPPRLQRAQNQLTRYRSMLVRVEQAYGVPGSVLVAIWGLETDFGSNIGNFATLRSVTTLAWDCRRAELFRGELQDVLRIIDRGDLAPADMRGAWAGEMGQTQLMPSSYLKYAVDFDGNGKRDLLRSPADVMASTANFLAGKGWKKGQPWNPGQPNFDALKEWNKSEVYAKTVAAFATQLENEH